MVDKSIGIIIAEDQQIVRLGLRFALEKFDDLNILGEADNGRLAIRMTVENQPQVVLMDVGLPEVNGIDATTEIKTAAPSVRVLMLTVNDSEEAVFSAFAAGADGYCLKNTDSQQIANAIRAVSSGATWLDPGIAKTVLRAMQNPTQATRAKAAGSLSKFDLSPREKEILSLIVEGLSNTEIASRLIISTETVKTHVRHVMEKLAVADRTQAAVKALKEGLF